MVHSGGLPVRINDKIQSFIEGLDKRRFFVKVGSTMILHLAGPGLFVKSWGFNGIIWYILILCVVRWLASEAVSRTVSDNLSAGPTIYRFSGITLFLVAIPTFIFSESEIGLISIPVLVSFFVAAFWVLHFEISDCKEKPVSPQGYQASEVWASITSAGLVLLITHYYSIEYAAGLGALISLVSCFYPVDVNAEQFRSGIEILRGQAASRKQDDIDNGALIVRLVATISFCSLCSLRLHIFFDPASVELAVKSLAIISASAELITFGLTEYKIIRTVRTLLFWEVPVPHLVKREEGDDLYGNLEYKKISLISATLGFLAMMPLGGPWYVFYIGYILVTTVLRTFGRTADRKFSRAALRGVGKLMGLREIYRYRRMAALTPLLMIPSSMPVVGICAIVILSRAKLQTPPENPLTHP